MCSQAGTKWRDGQRPRAVHEPAVPVWAAGVNLLGVAPPLCACRVTPEGCPAVHGPTATKAWQALYPCDVTSKARVADVSGKAAVVPFPAPSLALEANLCLELANAYPGQCR